MQLTFQIKLWIFLALFIPFGHMSIWAKNPAERYKEINKTADRVKSRAKNQAREKKTKAKEQAQHLCDKAKATIDKI